MKFSKPFKEKFGGCFLHGIKEHEINRRAQIKFASVTFASYFVLLATLKSKMNHK